MKFNRLHSYYDAVFPFKFAGDFFNIPQYKFDKHTIFIWSSHLAVTKQVGNTFIETAALCDATTSISSWKMDTHSWKTRQGEYLYCKKKSCEAGIITNQ